MTSRGERGLWQRRYWEHTIRDDLDCTDGQHASQPSQARSRGAPGGLAVFVVSSVRRRRAISCLGGGAAAMNRNRPANGSESKRRRQGGHKTSSPSGGAPASGCGGMRCAVPPYACCRKSAAKTLPLVESPRTIAGRQRQNCVRSTLPVLCIDVVVIRAGEAPVNPMWSSTRSVTPYNNVLARYIAGPR